MQACSLRECFPHRGYGVSDIIKEKDILMCYLNFAPPTITHHDKNYFRHKQVKEHTTVMKRFPPYTFTHEDLAFSLHGKTVVQPIDTERIQRKRHGVSHPWTNAKRKFGYNSNQHDGLQENVWSIPSFHLTQTQSPSNDEATDKTDIAPSNAVMSFLPEVQLCMSSLPGGELGVCSRKEIPRDTVLGPYKGRRLKPQELRMGTGAKMSFLWEIYKHGELDHYLDGSDENVACWMRFIRSARNKEEQNLCAIQHGENIFYRALKNIPVGTELLVWYEDKYEEYFGIPMILRSDKLQKASKWQEMKRAPSAVHKSLCREPLTPAMLKTMERTRVWVDEKLEVNMEDDEEGGFLEFSKQNSYCDDDSSCPGSHSSDGEMCGLSPEEMEPHSWKCCQCQQSFSQRSALRIHVCPKQTNKPYDCGHCSLSFNDPQALRAHVATHTNDRLFKCGYCGRRFAGATTLGNHIRTHTGEKPFSCIKCGKNFSQASQLSRHQRIVGDCL